MSKVGFVADVHLGNHRVHGGQMIGGMNDRCRLALDTFYRAIRVMREHEAEPVVCGDLFDSDKPEPRLIYAVMQATLNVSVIFVVGNHDQSSPEPHNHAMAPLGQGDIVVGSEPFVGTDPSLLLVPYMPGDAREWLPRMMARTRPPNSKFPPTVLATHVGLIDDETPPWLRNAHDAIEVERVQELMGEHNIAFTVAGNWHQHRAWSFTPAHPVVQIGALCPTGFDNPGFDGYGSVIIWDDGRDRGGEMGWQRIEVPGPRFVIVQGDDAVEQYRAAAERAGAGMHTLYVRWKVASEKADAALRQMKHDLKSPACMVGGFDTHPVGDGREEAREAAAAARASYGGWEEALRVYVEKMALDVSIDREQVFKLARSYLVGR